VTGSRKNSAFTLVELLVVMGLLAALATVSTSGYYAVVRGMEERGAIAAATSVVHAAQQRARIDRVPTALYLYNELIAPSSGETDAKVQGVAVAVRMGGRISWASGDYLCDEFVDLFDTYGVTDANNAKSFGMRLYKMPSRSSGTASKLDYCVVGSSVVLHRANEMDFISWSEKDSKHGIPMYAFVKSGGSAGSATFKTGDAYAFEFTTVRLPTGYSFGVGKPTLPNSLSKPIEPVRVFIFSPDDTSEDLGDASGIQVYANRPSKTGAPELTSIGKVQKESKDI